MAEAVIAGAGPGLTSAQLRRKGHGAELRVLDPRNRVSAGTQMRRYEDPWRAPSPPSAPNPMPAPLCQERQRLDLEGLGLPNKPLC